MHKSAVTDHIGEQNYVIDWDGAKVIEKDFNKQTRWIRKRGPNVLNGDEGVYSLSHVYDQLLQHRTPHSMDRRKIRILWEY